MNKEIENIIKKNLPEEVRTDKYETPEEKIWGNGFNKALSQINTSLIADEVLKVVVETGEKLSQCISEIRKIDNQRMIEASKNNRVYDASVTFWCQVMEKELLESILSPNKENKNNG